jgi:uncharacterized alpha-E superfamily protein
MMLARVADSLYWMGRYIERAEHVSRLSDVMLTASLDASGDALLAARTVLGAVGETQINLDGKSAVDVAAALVLDREDPNSVIISLARARENARQVRDQITTETWERLNLLFLRITSPKATSQFEQASLPYLHELISDLFLFKGAVDTTMSHGEGWRFLMLGIYLERAQLIVRLLDVCFGEAAKGRPLNDHLAQMNLLRMACALEPYLRVYTADIQPKLIQEFLLFNEEFPRSIRFSTARIEEHLRALTSQGLDQGSGTPERLAGRLSSRLRFADLEEMALQGASGLLATVNQDCARIHEAIYGAFVDYPLEQHLPG